MQKSNLGIFQQYSEEIEMPNDCSASYISYPNFLKAVDEILQREKANPVEKFVMPKIAEELKNLIVEWKQKELQLDEESHFCSEHKFEVEGKIIYEKRNALTRRRLELESIIDSNFSA